MQRACFHWVFVDDVLMNLMMWRNKISTVESYLLGSRWVFLYFFTFFFENPIQTIDLLQCQKMDDQPPDRILTLEGGLTFFRKFFMQPSPTTMCISINSYVKFLLTVQLYSYKQCHTNFTPLQQRPHILFPEESTRPRVCLHLS